MKKTILASMLAAATIFAACNSNGKSNNAKETTTSNKDTSKMTSQVKYTCTMHPEVISDTPGHCPQCGMQMVPIKDTTTNKK